MGIYRKSNCHKAQAAIKWAAPTARRLLGQAATEYLVIIGVVLLISIVSISLLGFFPGMGADAKISQSDSYWQSARPFAILAHSISGAPVDTSDYWAFDEGAGTSASDSVGGHTATLTNAAWVDGKYGSALSFSGNNSYALSTSAVSTTSAITIEAWVNPSSLTGYQTIVDIGSASNTTGFNWFYFYSNRIYLRFAPAVGSSSGISKYVSYTPPLGTWTHIAVTQDYAAKEIKFYVNGVQQGATQAYTEVALPISNKAVRMGAYSSSSYFFNGSIDNLRVYDDEALSQGDVSDLASRAAEGMQMVLQLNGNNYKTISTISVGSQNATVNQGIGPGEKRTLALGINHGACESGTIYEYNVSIAYSTSDMPGLKQIGAKNLVGKCT